MRILGLTGVCQWKNWSAIEKICKESLKDNRPSLNLSKFQFLPYHQYKNNEGVSINEEIVALEQWGKYPYDVINVAYNQIVDKVFEELK